MNRRLIGLGLAIIPAWILGALGVCRGFAADTVVVYSALDREFADPVLKAYGEKTGVRVLSKFDVESTKTVGLTNLIMAESRRPRCDLFWNNEILNTLRLKEKGLLMPFRPSHAGDLPETFKAKDGTWYGFAARARVIVVNTKLVKEANRPRGIEDLLDPKWKGKIGIAKPLFGTTATHAACLFAAWGDEKARRFFRGLKANGVQVLVGNKQVAIAAGSGEILVGLTDTDDAMGEIDAGSPVAIVYPDRRPNDLGTLFIPNTLAIIKGSSHQAAAQALADHLLSPEVESALAIGPSARSPCSRAPVSRRGSKPPRPSMRWKSTLKRLRNSGTRPPRFSSRSSPSIDFPRFARFAEAHA